MSRSNDEATSARTPLRTPRRAAIAAWTGSALEYYDMAIYGTAAALVFPKIFFPEGNASAAVIASLATFGVGYVARPIGSFLMGHIGDRFGRKTVLLGTVLLMGAATFLIGCLPTYHQVGLLAPALLVALRLIQGLSASGEQAGANSMSFEHAPENRRGLITSFTLNGTQAGQVLAPLVFLAIQALPEKQLMSWGWRAAFWVSAIVALIGYLIRRRLDESPEFRVERAEDAVPSAPLGVLFRDHWRSVLRVFFAAFIAMVNTVFSVFALSFATDDVYGIGISASAMLWLAIIANIVALGAIPAWAALSDRIGRKPVFVGGLAATAVMVVLFLWSISIGSLPAIMITGIVMAGVTYSMPNSVWPVTYAEYFPTATRLSGVAIGTQFGFALAGFTPSIAGALMAGDAGNWYRVAIFAVLACAASAVAVLSGPRRTHKLPTRHVGLTDPTRESLLNATETA